MEQFSLEKYLENPSRKVVTRRGNPVRIICTDRKHGEDTLPIVFLEETPDGIGEFLLSCRADGTCDNYDTPYDLFFADEGDKSQSIEIPFGAKDSEFIKDEYYIPEGCEARIEGNKVIIEKIQKEELTEFEKELINLVFKYKYWDSSKDKVKRGIKKDSKLLLDLARKEILKDFPKWKKATDHKEFALHVCVIDNGGNAFLDTEVNDDEYYIEMDDLKTLPKEE